MLPCFKCLLRTQNVNLISKRISWRNVQIIFHLKISSYSLFVKETNPIFKDWSCFFREIHSSWCCSIPDTVFMLFFINNTIFDDVHLSVWPVRTTVRDGLWLIKGITAVNVLVHWFVYGPSVRMLCLGNTVFTDIFKWTMCGVLKVVLRYCFTSSPVQWDDDFFCLQMYFAKSNVMNKQTATAIILCGLWDRFGLYCQ